MNQFTLFSFYYFQNRVMCINGGMPTPKTMFMLRLLCETYAQIVCEIYPMFSLIQSVRCLSTEYHVSLLILSAK